MEDPLHSVPTIVNYFKDRKNDISERLMFIGTNSGYLHAIKLDKNTPQEVFSFIPKELLQNLDKYYGGGELLETKAYGIDGPITHWHQDLNGNGNVEAADGEKVYVYITLRRGGQSLYALDVTNPSTPLLAWQKHGDYPADFPNKPAVSPGYEKMGQTWAQLEPATVAWDNEQRVVLFTAGGYDPIEDGSDRNGPATRITHSKGNSIYMIDAVTGELLWDASQDVSSATSTMTSSFAANVAPVDTQGDGLANAVFATDTGGRIWRFDINMPSIQASLPSDYVTDKATFASGGAIADVNEGTNSSNRRFFNEVDVVYQRATDQILLSVGSGYRAHPLTTSTQDHHYLIKTSVNKPDAYTTITQNMLAPWGTDNDFGWYIALTTPGEKVLSRSATIGNNILITSFAPNDPTTTIACNSDPGQTFLYNLSMTHDSGSISYTLNRQQTTQGGIPPSPVLISPLDYGPNGGNSNNQASKRKNILVGTEIVTDDTGKALEVGDPYDNITKDYWLEKK
jgi:type IV pilus assembly protein PilY1